MNGHCEQSGIILHAPVQGTYFDGITSKAWKVQVTVEWSELRLRFQEQFNLGRELCLPVEGIRQVESLSNGRFLLHCGTDTNASLEVDDPQLLRKIDFQPGRKKLRGRLDIWAQNIGWGRLAAVAFLVAAFVAGLYLWALPAVSLFAAGHLPAAAEKKIGDLLINKILGDENIDTAGSETLRSFCRELGFSGTFPLEPVLVRKKIANAFAVPGGHIVVYDSIIGLMGGYETMAALMAHEYAHVELHHTIKMMARSIASYAFVSVLFGDFSGITATLIDNANMLQNLHYQRGMEREADLKGAGMLAARGIDPDGMVKLLEGLQPLGGVPKYLAWASTHPDMEDRIAVTKKHNTAVKWTKGKNDTLKALWTELRNRQKKEISATAATTTTKRRGL
jgi:Zn-dependent protease with chaperone function